MKPPSLSKTVDCEGLRCPMPIVRVAKAVRDLEAGELLKVVASDPAFPADIRAWAEMTGNELLELSTGELFQATIRVR